MRSAGRSAGPFAVAALSLLSAGFHCGEMGQVKLGEPFEVRVGEKVSVEGELVLTFLGVLQDSRCPKGVQCIVAGEARLSFEAAPREGTVARFELSTSESEEVETSGFRIGLLSLTPYPVDGRTISSQDYLAKILVRR